MEPPDRRNRKTRYARDLFHRQIKNRTTVNRLRAFQHIRIFTPLNEPMDQQCRPFWK